MRTAEQVDPRVVSASLLPTWLRHALVAIGVLIFSSCRPLTPEQAALWTATMEAGNDEVPSTTDRPPDISRFKATSENSPGVREIEFSPQSHRLAAAESPDDTSGWVSDGLQVLPSQDGPNPVWTDMPAEIAVPGVSALPSASGVPSVSPNGSLNGAACPPGGEIGPQPCAACTPLGPGDEYLCDGGDFGSPAGVRADWSVAGLEQEDAIAHYDTVDGRILVTPSNRVCIYAPRFAAVRQVINPLVNERPEYINVFVDDLVLAKATIKQPPASSVQRHAVAVDLASLPPILFRQRQHPGGLENLEAAAEVYNSLAPYCNVQIIRLGQVNGAETAIVRRSVQNAITWTGNEAPQVVFGTKAAQAQMDVLHPEIIYQTNGPEHPRLRLVKMASTGNALLGEEVEFTLRFDNVGDQVIGNVTIVDNLATRLEYVEDSAKSTVDAKFTTAPNTGGSTILRWEITPPVQPGQGGILQFRARVR